MNKISRFTLVVVVSANVLALLNSGAIYALEMDPQVQAPVTKQVSHGAYLIESGFDVRASSQVAWEVLSDYDHIAAFVSSMRESRVRERRPGGVLLEQGILGRALFISREVHVLLDVREDPYRALSFRDVSGKDFDVYEGSWSITQTPEGLRIGYTLKAKPRSWMLPLIGRRAFKASARKLLDQVRAEMLRRTRRWETFDPLSGSESSPDDEPTGDCDYPMAPQPERPKGMPQHLCTSPQAACP